MGQTKRGGGGVRIIFLSERSHDELLHSEEAEFFFPMFSRLKTLVALF